MRAMNITLNGEPKELADKTSIASLTEDLILSKKRFAVEVNEQIIPRSLHTETMLSDGDVVEIVVAIGGG